MKLHLGGGKQRPLIGGLQHKETQRHLIGGGLQQREGLLNLHRQQLIGGTQQLHRTQIQQLTPQHTTQQLIGGRQHRTGTLLLIQRT